MSIRAVRNNNPGNIVAGDHWQGLMPRSEMSPEQLAETRFAVFASPKWGFRAMGVILLNYEHVHHLRTIAQIIARWAPPSENNTFAYQQHVAKIVGVPMDEPVDVTDPEVLGLLMEGISDHECGGWLFLDSHLQQGVALALA